MIRIVKVPLRRDKLFVEWAHRMGHVTRYVYNRAVSEYLFDGEYMERVVVDILQPFKLPNTLDSFTSSTLDDYYQVYDFGPSKRRLKYGMYKQLTKWRAKHTWLRECPVSFGRGAIQDASIACRRVMDDNSNHAPYRRKDGRIILSCANPPVRKDDHTVRIPGYGIVKTAKPINTSLDMRSFKIVDVTKRVDKHTKPSDHMFELHIAVHEPVKPHRNTGVVRGVDVGGKHLAVTVDTNGNVTIHNTRHREILREIDALKSIRDHKVRHGRKWCVLNYQIKQLYRKADGIAVNTINQTVSYIVQGADAIIAEILSIQDMTTHGGNYKRAMNRSMRENRLGEFLRKLAQRCEREGIPLCGVMAKYTSQTCHMCGHVDSESRITRDKFICTNCTRVFHADINAAWNILHRAAGKVVLRRPGHKEGYKPTPAMLRSIQQGRQKRLECAAGAVYFCI
ncbi:MAG: transposase [Cenarchaeum sp. SB0663_bin_5]|nr:transposase [Cenarchaeum sp. SB0663_bin_5]MYH04781.1 transposase [Cenarchaeum sp. SB0675_bin_21]MYL11836.1 transposase [Cenarchaeum sp. SB0669_bin_11]